MEVNITGTTRVIQTLVPGEAIWLASPEPCVELFFSIASRWSVDLPVSPGDHDDDLDPGPAAESQPMSGDVSWS